MQEDLSIREAVPHIFQRPLLYISSSDPMLQAATFLSTGPQIYVDGLVVLDDSGKSNLVGRIGGYALAKHILSTRERWLEGNSSEILEPVQRPLYENDLLVKALEVFAETRFAFVPIASSISSPSSSNRDTMMAIIASLCIRDLLGIASRELKNTRVKEITSEVLTIDVDATVLGALEFMVREGIRNLVFFRHGKPYLINDRKVLAYILSKTKQGKKMSSPDFEQNIANIKLNAIGATKGKQIDPEVSADLASQQFDLETPCLFAGDKILTPWDVVMKGFGFL
jgi:CBS domain-containing protein